MKCPYCGDTYSAKVMDIHIQNCPHMYDQIKKEANEITLETATKADLMVYIMSQSGNTNEQDLKKMLKKDLYEMAVSIRDQE